MTGWLLLSGFHRERREDRDATDTTGLMVVGHQVGGVTTVTSLAVAKRDELLTRRAVCPLYYHHCRPTDLVVDHQVGVAADRRRDLHVGLESEPVVRPRVAVDLGNVSRHVMSCHVMECHAMQCNAMQCNAMQCNVVGMRRDATECNGMQWNTMKCNAMDEWNVKCDAMRHRPWSVPSCA